MSRRFLATALRLSTLALRFLLIFLLARLLDPADVGLYGLFVATIAYAIYPLGFDFYTYATRALIRSDASRWRSILTSQLAFACAMFVLLLPAFLGIFSVGLLPRSLLVWFLLVLPLEYATLEIDRLLIAANDQFGASVVLFVGGALSPITAVSLMALWIDLRRVETVFVTCAAFDVAAILVGGSLLIRHSEGGHATVNLAWIISGMRVAFPFLVGTVCLRAIFAVDREVVKIFSDFEVLGAYTFYISIGAGLTSVVNAGVHQFLYPKLVRAATEGDRESFDRIRRSLFMQTLVVLGFIVVCALAAEPLLLKFVRGGVYREYAWLLPVTLAAVALYNLAMVPHYALYAIDADRAILAVTVLATACFVAVALIGARWNPPLGSAVGIGCGSLVLWGGKAAVLSGRLPRHSWKAN